jgi:hypothetical protein
VGVPVLPAGELGLDVPLPRVRERPVSEDRDWADQPYVKVYRSVIRDLGPVYRNKAQFGAWVSLLLEADATYPAPAALPRWLDDDVLAALAGAGLVVVVDDDHYTISGLAKERIAQEMGRRKGGLARVEGAERDERGRLLPSKSSNQIAGDAGVDAGDPATDFAGDQHHQLPNPTKPNQDEPSPADQACDPADDYWSLTGRWPNDRVLPWIDGLTEEFGAQSVSRAIAGCFRENPSTKTLMGRAEAVLRRSARQLDRQERAAEMARIEANRAKGVNVPILIARHNNGQHADDMDPNCPSCRRAA